LETVRARHTCAHRVDELLAICAELGIDTRVKSDRLEDAESVKVATTTIVVQSGRGGVARQAGGANSGGDVGGKEKGKEKDRISDERKDEVKGRTNGRLKARKG
jgi:hypothetical protein